MLHLLRSGETEISARSRQSSNIGKSIFLIDALGFGFSVPSPRTERRQRPGLVLSPQGPGRTIFFQLLVPRPPIHQAREWRSAAEHFDRRFPASLRRDLVSLRAATKTPRRRLRCRAGDRLGLLRYDVGRITIVAIPRGSIVAIPRRTDPHPARADGASEMRKGCSAVARRYRDPLWPRNCRPDHRSSESATEGHGMAASNASSGSFGRRRNQPGQENGEETRCNSNGHRQLPRTALLLQAAWVLPSGKPTMDSCGILELAPDLENGKRPCAEYGGSGDERCKY